MVDGPSKEDIHGLCDVLPAERTAAGGSPLRQDVGTGPAEAEVAAGQQQHRLAQVLADDALLPLLLLLQEHQKLSVLPGRLQLRCARLPAATNRLCRSVWFSSRLRGVELTRGICWLQVALSV